MKQIFAIILILLVLASFYTWKTQPERQSERPVISWKSDPNPQRYEQIELFNQWCLGNGHVDQQKRPKILLQLDAANNQSSLIQAVSGVGGDIIDAQVQLFAPMGVCCDISKLAANSNFSLDDSYPGARTLLSWQGRQYAYPCNIAVAALWFNLDTLAQFGIDFVPEEWTPDEFEAIGRLFVQRANAGLSRQEFFFCGSLDGNTYMLNCMARSRGLDLFNETMTAATCNDQRFVDAMQRLYKWTYVDKLAPCAAEMASMNSEAGYGGGNFSQLQYGKFASILTGRYALIRFRSFNRKINFATTQVPMHGFKNLIISSRSAIMYKGTKNPELTKLFFEFLGSKTYNDYIIKEADGLPPNPKYACNNPDYLQPQGYENEGQAHANELKWAMNIALPAPASPYCKATDNNWLEYALNKYFNNLASAEQVLIEAEKRFNQAIRDSLEANPELQKNWQKQRQIQQKINDRKKTGQLIPVQWISNPFYLKYYQETGRLLTMPEERP
ncbi:MAG: ABC transporter substrate-binding protein [Lentisphaeria bacterium]